MMSRLVNTYVFSLILYVVVAAAVLAYLWRRRSACDHTMLDGEGGWTSALQWESFPGGTRGYCPICETRTVGWATAPLQGARLPRARPADEDLRDDLMRLGTDFQG